MQEVCEIRIFPPFEILLRKIKHPLKKLKLITLAYHSVYLDKKTKIQIHKFLHGDINNPDKLLKPLCLNTINFIQQSLKNAKKLFLFYYRLGLFVLGCSPGGNGSNFWTLLLNGDINLSITMTFVSTIAALGMMPFWIYTLGPYVSEDDLVIISQQIFCSSHFLVFVFGYFWRQS